MVKKGIRGGICLSIHRYGKANNKYIKIVIKIKNRLYLKYWDVNDLYGWEMLQELPVNDFKWIF